jgi:hypothetical protein
MNHWIIVPPSTIAILIKVGSTTIVSIPIICIEIVVPIRPRVVLLVTSIAMKITRICTSIEMPKVRPELRRELLPLT